MSGTIPTNVVAQAGTGVVSGAQLNTYVQTDQTVAQLRGFIGVSAMAVLLQGYNAPNDGGAGFFYWATGSYVDDGGVTTVVPSGQTGGAWLRLTLLA